MFKNQIERVWFSIKSRVTWCFGDCFYSLKLKIIESQLYKRCVNKSKKKVKKQPVGPNNAIDDLTSNIEGPLRIEKDNSESDRKYMADLGEV